MISHYVLGIDLGQTNDPAAVVLLEHAGGPNPTYAVCHAQRFPLGTSYPDLVERISSRVNEPPLLGRNQVAIDSTGVGQPVVDLLRPALRSADLYAVTISGGTSVGGTGGRPTIPKRDLVSTAQVILQQRRLRIASALPEATALIDELLNFRVTISDAGHDSYSAGRSRDHDDLVLALCLAVWTAENRRPPGPAQISAPRGRIELRFPNPGYNFPL